ncbi:Hypothetical_protein [Hexamita inflata]|uniref:Hypothetical_protein n=1 Tax=Hexamita inflata TaxID=28002 RepID=A0AA86NQU2_9EUKA|nr:Hypothetical protein HINF_LOCUS11662 [Hexamita inflata]
MYRKLNKNGIQLHQSQTKPYSAKYTNKTSKSVSSLIQTAAQKKQLQDIQERPEPNQMVCFAQCQKPNLSTLNQTNSKNIFWDLSSLVDIKLLSISECGGKKKIDEIIISVDNNVTTDQTEDDDAIYSLLFK